jgi:hypothetical protein
MLEYDGVRVAMVMVVTIALEVLLAFWSQQRSYGSRALDPSVEPTVAWSLIVIGTVAVIAMLGPKRQITWFVATIFVVATVLCSFFVSQIVLSYTYK